jgi:fatty-acyl-CoA synthase
MPDNLSYAKGPDTPPVREITIGDALREAAAAAPDRVALIAASPDPAARREWTYAQLLEEAECLARALLVRFKPGERVAIWAPNIPQWVITEYGAALAGVILVTVNPSYQPEEVKYVLNQSQASGILVLREFRGNKMAEHVEAVRGECEHLRDVILFEDWDALIEEGRASDRALPDVAPMDPVMIQYTSGTTGFPKGALLHHKCLVNNADHTYRGLGFEDGGIVVGVMPLFHTAGCVLSVLGTLALRGTLVQLNSSSPASPLR